jgi:hypothetical protein
MSETKRRMEITIETHELTIIRTHQDDKSRFVFCPNCRKKVASFRRSHAALIFRVAVGELNRLFQINSIHAAEDFALCGNSLAVFFNREIRYVKD